MCEPGYVEWIKVIFGDCVITVKDKVAFSVGLLSNVLWILSAAPQIRRNFKNKRVDGQSPFFFGLLFCGDVLSLIGLFIIGGIATQIITQSLYCLLDGVMFSQFIYYNYIKKKKQETLLGCDSVTSLNSLQDSYSCPAGALLTVMVASANAFDINEPYRGKNLLASIFGWLSCFEYCFSGVPQIIKNHKRKKVSNISPMYIILIIFGEGTYALAVMLRSVDLQYLWQLAPWIIGCFGPLTTDLIIAIQMWKYGLDMAEETSLRPEFPRIK